MKINNLRELQQLKPVASAKFRNPIIRIENEDFSTHIQKKEYTGLEPIWKLIKIIYDENQEYVSEVLSEIYKKPVKFTDKLSDLLIKFKKMTTQTGKSIEEIVTDIRSYLGYKCSFFRYQGNKLIPITSDRLLKAHELISKKESFVAIENVLYL